MKEGYKMTELGEIPVDWKISKISDIGEIISGGTPDTKVSEYWSGTIPWCTPTDITALKGKKFIEFTNRYITNEGVKDSSARLLPTNSLVVCTRATIGDCAINIIPITTNQGFKSIVLNTKWNVHFVYYLIRNSKDRIIQLSSGSTFLEISKKAFEGILIPFPPLPEQQKIATILSTVDEKIEVIDAQITQTKALKKGLMQKLLTRGIGHTKFKDSVLGEIPESWEVVKLGEVAKITSGGTPDRKNKSYWNGNIPWVTTTLINFNEIYKANEYITVEGLKNSSAKLFDEDTLLMALYGQGITRGKVAILKIKAATNQACAAIITDDAIVNKYYAFHYFVSKYEEIRGISNSGSQDNLSGGLLKTITVKRLNYLV